MSIVKEQIKFLMTYCGLNLEEAEPDVISLIISNSNSFSEALEKYMEKPASFDIAFERVIGVEGGYQAFTTDLGNFIYNEKGEKVLVGTKYGVSAKRLQQYWKEILGRDYSPTADDMKGLQLSESKTVYNIYDWTPIRGSEIINQPLADQLFDAKVNRPFQLKVYQRVLNEIGYAPRLVVDGIIGAKSIAATNHYAKTNPSLPYRAFREARINDYRKLAASNPKRYQVPVGSSGKTWEQIWVERCLGFDDY